MQLSRFTVWNWFATGDIKLRGSTLTFLNRRQVTLETICPTSGAELMASTIRKHVVYGPGNA